MLFLTRNLELVQNREKTYLTAAVAALGTTLTVKAVDTNAWTNADYIIVGQIGTETAEIVAIGAAVSDGTSLTVGAVRYAHAINEPVYRIDYNQIAFSRSATTTGTKTVLATNEIQVDDEFTRYEDTANSTGYGFVRFYNSTTAVYSQYSDAIPYTGYTPRSLGRMHQNVRRKLGETDTQFIEDEDITLELNEGQRDIAHERIWPFYEGSFSLSRVAYQKKYEIDSDAVYGKVYDVVVDSEPLAALDTRTFNLLHFDSNTVGEPTHFRVWNNNIELYPLPDAAATATTLKGTITATATALTLTDGSAFRSPGRLLIDTEVIGYEYIDSTYILYGVTRGMEGTTAAAHTTLAVVTERDIIYHSPVEPTELMDIQDETQIPDPSVLEDRACMNLSIGKLKDQVLHDRFKAKYEQGLARLRDKFGEKTVAYPFTIKDKDETTGLRNPNDYPLNLS